MRVQHTILSATSPDMKLQLHLDIVLGLETVAERRKRADGLVSGR